MLMVDSRPAWSPRTRASRPRWSTPCNRPGASIGASALSTVALSATANCLAGAHASGLAPAAAAVHGYTVAFTVSAALFSLGAILTFTLLPSRARLNQFPGIPQFGISYLFIAHNLDVVRYMADRIAVLKSGQIVELGRADKIATDPGHPYTRSLLAAMPLPDPAAQAEQRSKRLTLAAAEPPPSTPPTYCDLK